MTQKDINEQIKQGDSSRRQLTDSELEKVTGGSEDEYLTDKPCSECKQYTLMRRFSESGTEYLVCGNCSAVFTESGNPSTEITNVAIC